MILTYYTATTMIIIAYLLGSIPSAVWIGKKYYGIDIREYGSKNAGTTIMLRVLGRRAALPVFALDFLKGFVAVTLIEMLKYDENVSDMWLINLKIIAVFAAVLGHIFPIFAGFRGGKGVATLVGAVTGIYPPVALLCFGVWFVVLMITHYVSLSSMIAGCCFPAFTMISPKVNGPAVLAVESVLHPERHDVVREVSRIACAAIFQIFFLLNGHCVGFYGSCPARPGVPHNPDTPGGGDGISFTVSSCTGRCRRCNGRCCRRD